MDAYADLHVHSVYSDGTFTPDQLAAEAARTGLAAVAVVDHDTVDGIAACLSAARGVGIEVITGIELSAEMEGTEVHILGYFIDYQDAALRQCLASLKRNRIERIHRMVRNLNDLGVPLDADTVFAIAAEGTVGRLHLARALVKEGYTATTGEAFQKYIGDRSPAYVLGFKFSPREVVSLILGAGGVPVLAHPHTLRNDEFIGRLAQDGIRGLEVYYPEHSQSMINWYLEYARKYNLAVTGGSDCHGAAKPGVPMGAVKIPYGLVENLKRLRR